MTDPINSDLDFGEFLASVLREYEAVIAQLVERTAWRPLPPPAEATPVAGEMPEAA